MPAPDTTTPIPASLLERLKAIGSGTLTTELFRRGLKQCFLVGLRPMNPNAAKFAGVAEIDVYAEVTDEGVAVFVRDRGSGFDRAAVPADRRGLVESIEGRLERAGGRATVTSAPGEGTEVELRLPRSGGAS